MEDSPTSSEPKTDTGLWCKSYVSAEYNVLVAKSFEKT